MPRTGRVNIAMLMFVVLALAVGANSQSQCDVYGKCPAGQCCVVIGTRRSAGVDIRAVSRGVCQQIGVNGSNCFMAPGIRPDGKYNFRCPCGDDLHCVWNGFFNSKGGSTGNCRPGKAVPMLTPDLNPTTKQSTTPLPYAVPTLMIG
ncbi:uncharacterized protein LOC124141737 [Haliotis rufescens]|uniref:uncharacterized protein LOC124141737 n=1 Tax=Haliotis rufescens TaxID=6454 RepID=UPI00201E7F9C|nr:uncharacterized protein LOC124141737 [Haliotis rufescens]